MQRFKHDVILSVTLSDSRLHESTRVCHSKTTNPGTINLAYSITGIQPIIRAAAGSTKKQFKISFPIRESKPKSLLEFIVE